MVKSIKYNCVTCKRTAKRPENQIMGQIPIDRLKPAPAGHSVSLDYFGPLETKGEVNKRARGKAYGVMISCNLSRAVHIEVVDNYSIDSFLQLLRRFISLRGSPSVIRSDRGSQLTSANNELKAVIKGLDITVLKQFGAQKGISWKFTPVMRHGKMDVRKLW